MPAQNVHHSLQVVQVVSCMRNLVPELFGTCRIVLGLIVDASRLAQHVQELSLNQFCV